MKKSQKAVRDATLMPFPENDRHWWLNEAMILLASHPTPNKPGRLPAMSKEDCSRLVKDSRSMRTP